MLQPPLAAHPEYGVTAAEPYILSSTAESQGVDASRATADHSSNFDTLAYYRHPEAISESHPVSQRIEINPAAWLARPNAQDYSEYIENPDSRYTLLTNGNDILKVASSDYTRVGMVTLEGPGTYDTTLANIFYRGAVRPDAMPVSGLATYEGYWERALATHAHDYKNGYHGNMLSASRATFDVDFGARTLAGALQGQSGADVIDVQASIDGNRFEGTSTIKALLSADQQGVDISSNAAIRGSGQVQGVFYGAQANELAGHFMHDDKRFGGVFGAKQQMSVPQAKTSR